MEAYGLKTVMISRKWALASAVGGDASCYATPVENLAFFPRNNTLHHVVDHLNQIEYIEMI